MTLNFPVAVTYIQFPIQVNFSATSASQRALRRTWFSQLNFNLDKKEHFPAVTSNFDLQPWSMNSN